MLNTYVMLRESLLSLRNDRRGTVSFEYIIVAACVVAAVAATFSTDTTKGIGLALSTGLASVTSKIP